MFNLSHNLLNSPNSDINKMLTNQNYDIFLHNQISTIKKAILIQIEIQLKNSFKSFLFEVKVVLLQPEKSKDKQLKVTQICI